MRKKSAGRVLVVDDERLLRWAVAETLAARGYEVSEAGDAKSALEALVAEGSCTNVVLLDLFLPDATDLRVLKQIRTCAPNTPVVLMTAFATPEIVEQALAAGALFMPKPFDMDSLSALIEQVQALGRSGWNQSRAAARPGLNRDQIRYRSRSSSSKSRRHHDETGRAGNTSHGAE